MKPVLIYRGGKREQLKHPITNIMDGRSTSFAPSRQDIPYKDKLGGVMDLEGIAKTIRTGGRDEIRVKHAWQLVWG